MSITVVQEQVPIYLRYAYASLPKGLRATANALALHADNITGRCYPSKERLTYFSENQPSKLKNDFLELEKIGLLKRTLRKGSSTIYWLHPDPQSLFPCTVKSKILEAFPDDQSPFFKQEPPSVDLPTPVDNSQPVDNSAKSYPQPSHQVATPSHGVATPQPSGGYRTSSELCITTTAKKEYDLLKKQAKAICKEKRPDLEAEEIWRKFVHFYKSKSKEISLQKWEEWIARENVANPTKENEPTLSDNERCAKALAQFGIDYWTTQEQRTNQSWWAWMDANPHRRIK